MDDVIIWLVIFPILITAYLVAPVVTGLKGRSDLVAIGVFFHPVWWVGAFLLAKPESWWARKFYAGEKLARSQRKFPPLVRIQPQPHPQPRPQSPQP